MKILKKIIFFFSFVAFYFIGKEFLNLYLSLKEIDPMISWIFLFLVFCFLVYFILFPIIQILKLPKYPSPTDKKTKEKFVVRRRIAIFKRNKSLRKFNIVFSESDLKKENYNDIINKIQQESQKIRESHIKKVFIATAIAQNGFIDGIILMSSCVNLVKKTFILYGGRVSYKDLFAIGKASYYSIIISASEGVETGIEELIEKVGSNSIKAIPFAGKILESFADGFVSATLLCRVGLITENYCTKTYIQSEKDLYPGIQSVIKTVNPIAKSIKETIYDNFKKAIKENTVDKLGSVARNIYTSLNNSINSIKQSDALEFLDKEAEKSLKFMSKIANIVPFLK